MYGNYAPSGDPDNNTASGSFNINQLIELSKGYEKRMSKNKNTHSGPVRYISASGTKPKVDGPVRFRNAETIREKYNMNMKELDEDLNNSFIEDPNQKMMMTPSHKKSPDSGSFTEEMSLGGYKFGGNQGLRIDNSEQDQDSSLIRAFQPLQLNAPLSNSAMNPELDLKYIPNSRSPSKNNLSPDSGSFTLSVSSREDDVDGKTLADQTSSTHQIKLNLNSALKSLDEKPRFAPIRSGVKKNLYDMKPVRMNITTEIRNKENIEDPSKDKPSIRERMEALAQPSDVAEFTHPSTSSRLHISSSQHPNLKSQTSSRLMSAPALTGTTALHRRDASNDQTDDRSSVHRSFVQDILSRTSEGRADEKLGQEVYTPYRDHARPERGLESVDRKLSGINLADRTPSQLRPHSDSHSEYPEAGQRLTESGSRLDNSKKTAKKSLYPEEPVQIQARDKRLIPQSSVSIPPSTPVYSSYPAQTPQRTPFSEVTPRGSDTPRYTLPPRCLEPGPRLPETPASRLPETLASAPKTLSLPPRDPERTMPPPSMSISRSHKESYLVINNRRYKIMKLLGKGGSSRVYEAFDEQKNIVVAIKRVDLSNADEAQAEGYINEINMLSKLQGEDRIVRLYDFEKNDAEDILYVVMEKGDTDLATLLKNYATHKEITPAMIKHYWTEMLHAVSVIHKSGIIHSDLKPANFLLVAGRLKLIDFGIASSVQSDRTSVMKDTQMGTFNFMSPEAIQDLSGPQYDGSGAGKPIIKISYKSDVWSLGCILYNLAYGKMPFGDLKIPIMKLQAILNPEHKIPFPSANVDPLLLDVIKSCLTRDLKIRPSIGDLLRHSYVTGIAPVVENKDPVNTVKMLAALQGVLSPNTFEKTKRAMQDPHLVKKMNM